MLRRTSDAYCAGYSKAFREMPWPYRALNFGSILMPLSMTCGALLHSGGQLLSLMFWLNATMFWLLFGEKLALQARGAAATRRGIQPARNPLSNHVRKLKWFAIVSASMFGFVLLLTLQRWAVRHTSTYEEWAVVVFLFAIALMQACNYAYIRFWPAPPA